MASEAISDTKSKAQNEMLSQIIIDIKEPDEKLRDLNLLNRNIYRVPCTLRNLKEEAYTPQLISVGPIHYGKEDLKSMQKQKLLYFHLFWDRVSNYKAMKHFKNFLEKEEQAIRNCYDLKFDSGMFTGQKFVEILLLDSVFIMELFLRIWRNEKDEDDCIVKQTWLNKGIQRDLLLLENQIPLFILDELYSSVVPVTYQEHENFIDLAYEYFQCFDPYGRFPGEPTPSVFGPQKKFSVRLEMYNIGEAKHFTDLIRSFYLNLEPQHSTKKTPKYLTFKPSITLSKPFTRSATKLQEAGVSFEKVKAKVLLLNIEFKKVPILSWFLCLGCIPKFTCFKARLRIPQFQVSYTTECILKNLIALEQCHYADKPYVCNYVSFIDSLIQTKDDVELLVEREVIAHNLGSDKEVADIVNSLCQNVVTEFNYYQDILDELNRLYENPWNHSMAALKLVYFKDTWRTSSTVIGLAILIFTMLNFYRLLRDLF